MKKNIMKKLLTVILALVLVAGTTGLGTLHAHGVVDPVHNVTQNTYFSTIQGAIDDADAGDVIEVLPGTYSESLAVTVNDLTIRSTMGADSTSISGGTTAVQVEVKDFVLDGFSITATNKAVNILAVTSGDFELKNCVFDGAITGVYVAGEVKDTRMNIVGNTFQGGTNGVYTADSGDGICGTSVLNVEDNKFINQAYYGVCIEYVERNGSVEVTGNTISGSGYAGIYIDEMGYYYEDAPASVTVSDNVLDDCYAGIYLDTINYCTAIIRNNTINNSVDGVYIDYSAYETVTDVRILDNTITVDGDMDSADTGIYVYSAEKSLLISGNTITGYSDVLIDGILLDFIGFEGSEPSEVEITENTISKCESGIYLYDVGDEIEAEVLVADNEVFDTAYGVYIENMDSESAEVDLFDNDIHGNGYGVYLDDMSSIDGDEVALMMIGNMIDENETGIYLEYVYLDQGTPGIVITDNAVVDNGVGLTLQYAYVASNDLIMVQGNNFSGNELYGVQVFDDIGYTAPSKGFFYAPADPDFVLQAQWNWWGDPSGPEHDGNGAAGDEITGPIVYDPWIEELVLTPKDATGFQGKVRTFTAELLDSNGRPVDLPLTILFRITGINDLKDWATLKDGVATFSYTSKTKGTDTVFAGLTFAGALEDDLSPDTSAIWTAAGAEGNPDTGDSNLVWFAVMMSLIGLAGATVTILYRRRFN